MYSSVSYNALMGEQTFVITFPYLAEGHIEVYIDGVATSAFTIINGGADVHLNAPLGAPATVLIQRATPVEDPYVVFDPATTITSSNLNNMLLQSLYVVQESRDIAAETAAIVNAFFLGTHFDAQGLEIQNLGAPTALTSAATAQYVQDAAVVANNIPAPVVGQDGYFIVADGVAGTFGWEDGTAQMDARVVAGIAAEGFGTAAYEDTGILSGELPVLNTDDEVDRALLPDFVGDTGPDPAPTPASGLTPAPTQDDDGANERFLHADGTWARAKQQLLHVRDEKPNDTNGGGFTQDVWQTRDLNTEMTNEIDGASLASDQITLPAGTYYIEATAPAYETNKHKAMLYNTTDTAIVLVGTAEHSTTKVTTVSFVSGRFTLDDTKVLELRHRCQSTVATVGFGIRSSFGEVEVYADVRIWKVDD